MRRRDLLSFAGLAASLASSPARIAFAASVPPRVGFISGADSATAADFVKALRDGLATFGYIEPGGLKLNLLYADFKLERISALVDDLERSSVDVIVTYAAATSIVVGTKRRAPVIYEFSADPITLGIAKDL